MWKGQVIAGAWMAQRPRLGGKRRPRILHPRPASPQPGRHPPIYTRPLGPVYTFAGAVEMDRPKRRAGRIQAEASRTDDAASRTAPVFSHQQPRAAAFSRWNSIGGLAGAGARGVGHLAPDEIGRAHV